MEGIPIGVANVGGLGAFLVLATYNVLAFFRGWLYTGKQVRTMLDEAARITASTEQQRDFYQKAFMTLYEAGQIRDQAAMGTMIETSKTVARMIEALQDRASEGGDHGAQAHGSAGA
jgi:hypothetical protein